MGGRSVLVVAGLLVLWLVFLLRGSTRDSDGPARGAAEGSSAQAALEAVLAPEGSAGEVEDARGLACDVPDRGVEVVEVGEALGRGGRGCERVGDALAVLARVRLPRRQQARQQARSRRRVG